MPNFFVRSIPNTLTSANLFCGCIAVGYAFQNDLKSAFLFIILGAVFDFFDGLSARALNVSSAIGKELDSLADVITFGLAPATIAYSLLKHAYFPALLAPIEDILAYCGFIIAIFSALRLAKFNIDERQTTSFIGLPTPANALFWGAIAVGSGEWLISYGWLILLLVCFFSGLLVAELPMFSLKFKSLGWKENSVSYIFLLGCVVLLAVLGWTGLAACILWYIVLSTAIYFFGSK